MARVLVLRAPEYVRNDADFIRVVRHLFAFLEILRAEAPVGAGA